MSRRSIHASIEDYDRQIANLDTRFEEERALRDRILSGGQSGPFDLAVVEDRLAANRRERRELVELRGEWAKLRASELLRGWCVVAYFAFVAFAVLFAALRSSS